jgi:hypothetical protein
MKPFPGLIGRVSRAVQMKKILIHSLVLFALVLSAGCGPAEEASGEAEMDGVESAAEGAAKDEAMKDSGDGS